MEMIRCPRCAREIPDFSRFCRRCGCAIVWRAQIAPASIVPPLPHVQAHRVVTLSPPRQAKPAKKPAVRSSGGGGAGVFAIFAAAGLVCFVNYHAVMRPVMRTPPPRMGTVRYQSPSMPPLPPDLNAPPFLAPPPPPSYPKPLRSGAAPSSPRRYAPQAQRPVVPMPIAPVPPAWDSDYRYGSPRDERDPSAESSPSDRSSRRSDRR
jgi:hypothetical protein